MCCKTSVILLQGPLGVLEGLKDQLFFPLGLGAWQQGQVSGRPGQPPQELCVIAAWKQTIQISLYSLAALAFLFWFFFRGRHQTTPAENEERGRTCPCTAAAVDTASPSLRSRTDNQPAPKPPLHQHKSHTKVQYNHY